MIYILAVMLIVASLDSVRSDLEWEDVLDAAGTQSMLIADIPDSDKSAGDVSFKIRTDAASENANDEIIVDYKTAAGNTNGAVEIRLNDNGAYFLISNCQTDYEKLPDHLPVETDKVWNILKTTEPRIMVYVNGVEVVNFLLSDETCPYGSNTITWRDLWKGDVEGVLLWSYTSGMIAGYMFESCKAGQFLDMKIFQKSGCTDCPKDHWNANGNDHACKPCPGSESVGAGLGKAESDCIPAAEEDEAEHGDNHKDNPAAEEDEAEHGDNHKDNHNLSHAVALKISSILLVGLLFALNTNI